MFSALICLSFLPWSILNLKEKSERVILAELYSFRSHVVNKHTGLEYPSLEEVRRRCENYSKHESRATNNILLLFDFYISLPSSLCFGAP